ncbi:hypothetical protein [Oceanispirochaeta sp.]|jgi:outer membrane biosynthesis protein TonB|uniref:hypothetical protein n=1 Tax=Oceanispirochaeta sp. TaxID=2035350 RepID=UPI002619579F|nr:hypothetical protein [Oceanispirochaeta sp.]MDA3956482.1 hypothetical protein [Oceanispirochaeta sp.]
MTPYQIKRQKRRTLLSFLFAFLFHFLILGTFILYDYFFIEDLSDFSGPVLVKLGEPVGEDIPIMPEEKQIEEPVVPPEETPPPVPEVKVSEPSENTVPQALPEKVIEKPTPTPTPIAKPAEPVVNPAPTVPVTPPEPKPVIIKGEDGGNSYEYQFEAEEGVIGRSLSTDISLFMPLPQFISSAIYESLKGESHTLGVTKKDFFKQFYKDANGVWAFKSEVTPKIDDVRAIWDYLIKAGYDYKNADYKSGRNLNPVIIKFTISGSAELIMSEIYKSSDDSRIDEAVLMGFRSATFSNSSKRKINGRFTYRFD